MRFQEIIRNSFSDMHIIEEKEIFSIKAKRGPSNYIKIEKKLNQNLACFVGLILGDGSLRVKKARITIELTDAELIRKIKSLVEDLFNVKTKVKIRIDKRKNRKIRFYINIDNKAVYSLLNRIFGVPKGKKSHIIKVPKIIKESNINIKKAFLIGVLASDGGKRRVTRLGLSTASKRFRDDIFLLLKEIGINSYKESWINQKYKREYFGIVFNRIGLNELRECQSGQMGQILESFQNKIEVHA